MRPIAILSIDEFWMLPFIVLLKICFFFFVNVCLSIPWDHLLTVKYLRNCIFRLSVLGCWRKPERTEKHLGWSQLFHTRSVLVGFKSSQQETLRSIISTSFRQFGLQGPPYKLLRILVGQGTKLAWESLLYEGLLFFPCTSILSTIHL